jgi:hypothetical protein
MCDYGVNGARPAQIGCQCECLQVDAVASPIIQRDTARVLSAR